MKDKLEAILHRFEDEITNNYELGTRPNLMEFRRLEIVVNLKRGKEVSNV